MGKTGNLGGRGRRGARQKWGNVSGGDGAWIAEPMPQTPFPEPEVTASREQGSEAAWAAEAPKVEAPEAAPPEAVGDPDVTPAPVVVGDLVAQAGEPFPFDEPDTFAPVSPSHEPSPSPDTDTFEASVLPRRSQRMPIALAAVACALVVAGVAFLRGPSGAPSAAAAAPGWTAHDQGADLPVPVPAEETASEGAPEHAVVMAKANPRALASVTKVKAKSDVTPAPAVLLPVPPAVDEPAPPPPAKAEPPKVVVLAQSSAVVGSGSAVTSGSRGFDAVAAHAALDAVQPAACWASGTAHGYGRARVTFGENGAVKMVEIANPVQGAAPDTECIARKYAVASVPAFQGASVTAYTTFFVN